MARLRLSLTSGLTLAGLLLSLGCAAKRQVRTDIILPLNCLQGPVILKDCADADPQRCKQSLTTYKPGCEIVMPQKHK